MKKLMVSSTMIKKLICMKNKNNNMKMKDKNMKMEKTNWT